MKRKTKVILAIASVLLLILFIILLTVASINEADKRVSRDFYRKTVQTFEENKDQYEYIEELVKTSFVYDEICIIFNENGVFVKNDYSNVNVSGKTLRQELISFAEQTGVDVIYYDGDQTFFKTSYFLSRGHKKEANIIIRDDRTKPEYESCKNLSGDWYYTELDIS